MIAIRFCCRPVTYEVLAQPNRTRKRDVQDMYLSVGFGDCSMRITYSDKQLKFRKTIFNRIKRDSYEFYRNFL
jgi:hypothetical protein